MIQSKIRLPLVRVACALALALAGVVLFLQSQVASAATIFFSARGGNSFAFFQSVDSTGCLTTSVEVDAGENAVQQKPRNPATPPTPAAFVSIFLQDACTQESAIWMGFSTAVQYQFDKALTYASVQGNVTVCRIDVANACFDAALNVTWTGFGNFDTSNGTAHVRYGSSNFISQNLATVRAATATGTVSQGTTNYTPTPSFIAVMSWSVFHDISAP